MAIDVVGNVGDINVVSIAVGPKYGPYELGVKG